MFRFFVIFFSLLNNIVYICLYAILWCLGSAHGKECGCSPVLTNTASLSLRKIFTLCAHTTHVCNSFLYQNLSFMIGHSIGDAAQLAEYLPSLVSAWVRSPALAIKL